MSESGKLPYQLTSTCPSSRLLEVVPMQVMAAVTFIVPVESPSCVVSNTALSKIGTGVSQVTLVNCGPHLLSLSELCTTA